jgi:hypothetical protein
VIDELMGHKAGGRGQLDATTVGAHYRHTTPAMLARVVETVEAYLIAALAAMPQTCPQADQAMEAAGSPVTESWR